MKVYKFKIFEPFQDVIDHGVFTNQVIVSNPLEGPEYDIEGNRSKICKHFGHELSDLATPQQVHSKIVLHIEKPEDANHDADGLITTKPNILLMTKTSDCLPVLFFNPKTKEIAAVHAGREGVYKKILIETIKEMNGSAEDLLVGIGPHICGQCYTRDSVPEEFEKYFVNGALNLTDAAQNQLVSQGVKESQIEVMPICTKENTDVFTSYRGDRKGNFGTCIMLR